MRSFTMFAMVCIGVAVNSTTALSDEADPSDVAERYSGPCWWSVCGPFAEFAICLAQLAHWGMARALGSVIVASSNPWL
jgi:hypothetical protein